MQHLIDLYLNVVRYFRGIATTEIRHFHWEPKTKKSKTIPDYFAEQKSFPIIDRNNSNKSKHFDAKMFLNYTKLQSMYCTIGCASLRQWQWQQSEKAWGMEKQTDDHSIQRQNDCESAERRTGSHIPMSEHLALNRWSATCGMCVNCEKQWWSRPRRNYESHTIQLTLDPSRTQQNWVKFVSHLCTYRCLVHWVLFSKYTSGLSGFFHHTFQSFYLSFDIYSKRFSFEMSCRIYIEAVFNFSTNANAKGNDISNYFSMQFFLFVHFGALFLAINWAIDSRAI